LADWKFDLLATDTAVARYESMKTIAEAVVPSFERPLPLNSDPRLGAKLALVSHYERSRKILRSIMKPQDAPLDKNLIGVYDYVRYRTELGTCVYFARLVHPLAVLVYEISDAPLDPHAIRKLVADGNAHILARLRLPLPGTKIHTTIH
jgi:hypothetical protein